MSEGAAEPRAPEGEDPLSADRRTLVIAAVAMVVLIAVGVVSAALVTRSDCGLVEPSPIDAGAVLDDVPAVLAEALPGLGAADAEATAAALAGLRDHLPEAPGPPIAAAAVGPAHHLTVADGQLVAAGERLTALSPPGDGQQARAVAAAEVDQTAMLAGDGETLYSLALVNEPTGQVSAVVPVDGDLRADDCYDAANVGVPLAFHLDAGDGQLLLLRSDDDGELPEVELRDADGTVWSERVLLGTGPPGALAGRLDARLGDDLVVAARRVRGDEEPPAVQIWDRATGEQRWSVTPDEIHGQLPWDVEFARDEPMELDVVGVSADVVLIALGPEVEDDQPARRSRSLMAFDAADGDLRWAGSPWAKHPPRLVDGTSLVVAAGRIEDRLPSLGIVHVAEGDATQIAQTNAPDLGVDLLGPAGRLGERAAVVGEAVLIAAERGLGMSHTQTGGGRLVDLPVDIADVLVDGQLTALLLRHDGDAAVVWLSD